ncbi:TPA: hypothetical protein ACV4I4_002520 [Salmonella enterica]
MMGILGKFGDFLEKSGVSINSKETVRLLYEMNNQGVYISALTAVDFALSMREDESYESIVLSKLLMEPYDFNKEDCMEAYRMLQENYTNGVKMLKNSLSVAKRNNNGEELVKDVFNFKLMAIRIIMFNLAYSHKFIDEKISSSFYEKLWKATKDDTPDLSIEKYIERESLISRLGLSKPLVLTKKEDYSFHKDTISIWANRGIMNV